MFLGLWSNFCNFGVISQQLGGTQPHFCGAWVVLSILIWNLFLGCAVEYKKPCWCCGSYSIPSLAIKHKEVSSSLQMEVLLQMMKTCLSCGLIATRYGLKSLSEVMYMATYLNSEKSWIAICKHLFNQNLSLKLQITSSNNRFLCKLQVRGFGFEQDILENNSGCVRLRLCHSVEPVDPPYHGFISVETSIYSWPLQNWIIDCEI